MFKLFNPWVVGGVLASLIGAFLWGMSIGGDRCEAKYARDEARMAKVEERAQAGAAAAIAANKPVTKVYKQVLEREIRNIPTGTCTLSPDGVRALNALLAPRPKPLSGGELPGTESAP